MIKINLLPIKAARKREYVKQQLLLFLILVVGVGVAIFLLHSNMTGKIEDKQKQITHAREQIDQYTRAIGEVEKYKGLEDLLKRKLKIIDDLVRGKTGPVRVLDRLSAVMPNQVWLTKWEDRGGSVKATGEALNLKFVGQFMTVLAEPAEETAAKPAGGTGEAPGQPAPGKPPTPGQPAPAAAAAAAAPAPGQPVALDRQPPREGRKFFSNIHLVSTNTKDDATFHRTFVEFELSMNVNYAM